MESRKGSVVKSASKTVDHRAKISASVKRTLARKNRRIKKALDLLARYEKQNGLVIDAETR